MGSQAVHNARIDAPAAIVIRLKGDTRPWHWFIAVKHDAWQPDRSNGGSGPVVLTYRLAPGLPYATEAEAQTDAALILARETKDLNGE